MTGTSGDIIDKVRAGTLAAALVDGPASHDDLNGCIAFREEMVLITSLEHAPIHSARDTQGDTLFAFGNSCSYRTRLESGIATARAHRTALWRFSLITPWSPAWPAAAAWQ